jgi:hypothetical protein
MQKMMAPPQQHLTSLRQGSDVQAAQGQAMGGDAQLQQQMGYDGRIAAESLLQKALGQDT